MSAPLIGRFLKILLAVLASLLTLEVLLALTDIFDLQRSFYVYDPDMGFRVRPYAPWGAHRANEFGFNDRDYPHEKAPGVIRILILGDSFNWAGGQDGNYAAILERAFDAELGSGRVEVINAGYPGTHTGEELQALERFGLQYDPDLALLGFFAGNDFLDATPWRKVIPVAGQLTEIDLRTDPGLTLFGRPLVLRSRTRQLLRTQWLRLRRAWRSAEPADAAGGGSIPTEEYRALELGRMQIANLERAAEFREHEAYVFDRLLAMRDLLAARRIGLVIVAYPDEFQVDAALRQAIIERYALDPATYDWDRPQKLLGRFCAERDVECHDMLPAFREAHQRGERLYLLHDTHWNDAGNELAARFLFGVLVERIRGRASS